MQASNKKAILMKTRTKSTTKTNKLYVTIDKETILKLNKLGHMDEIQSYVIKKLVDHAHICDKWWLERDEEEHS